MNLKEAIYTRRSVRDFTADPVDEKTLTELIDAAIQAPSAVNQQPCSFCVVRDKALLTKISREAKAFRIGDYDSYIGCSGTVRCLCCKFLEALTAQKF